MRVLVGCMPHEKGCHDLALLAIKQKLCITFLLLCRFLWSLPNLKSIYYAAYMPNFMAATATAQQLCKNQLKGALLPSLCRQLWLVRDLKGGEVSN